MELPTSAWRVKVYKLKDEQWLDRGTGYCNGELVSDPSKQDGAYLVVRNEENPQDVLLKTRVFGSIQYQKQQGTLIVWTDQKQSEMALSFQEEEGCSVICDFLVFVQENFEHDITILSVNTNLNGNTGGGYEVTELIAGSPTNPPPEPELGCLAAVLDSLSVSSLSSEGRESLIAYIQEDNYIQKLNALFKVAEAEKSLEDLHNLCRITKLLFVINDASLYEILLDDSNILSVVGMLEYDSEFPTFKANYREYMSDEARFNEVVTVHNASIKHKIIQTFRLQFMKDVALARVLDDGTSSMMASLIYYNQIEIVSFIQVDGTFARDLFDMYNETGPEHGHEPGPYQDSDSDKNKDGSENEDNEHSDIMKSGKETKGPEETSMFQQPLVEKTSDTDENEKGNENENEKSNEKENENENGSPRSTVSPDPDPHPHSDLEPIPTSYNGSPDSDPPAKKLKLDPSESAKSPSPSLNTPKSETSLIPKDSIQLKRKRDGVRFIHQLTQMVKGFQQHQKSLLYSSLVDNGLLKLVIFALNDYEDTKTKLLGTELSITLIEHDPNIFKNADGDLGIKILVDLFVNENNVLLKSQAAEAIKIQWDASMGLAVEEKLSDIVLYGEQDEEDTEDSTDNNTEDNTDNSKDENQAKSVGSLGLVRKNGAGGSSAKDGSKDALKFEQRVYKIWMPTLFQQLIDLSKPTAEAPEHLGYSQRLNYEQLCDILTYCLNRHSTRSRAFVTQYNLWSGITKLFTCWSSRQVQLAAIRCLKAGLDTMVGDYETNLLESGVLTAFLKLMIRLGNKNNLLHSACLDLLEHVYRLSTPPMPSKAQVFSFETFALNETSGGYDVSRASDYDNTRSELFIFEWMNRNKDLFEQLEDFAVVKRLRIKFDKLVKESQEKEEEAQKKKLLPSGMVSGEEELEDSAALTSDDESTGSGGVGGGTNKTSSSPNGSDSHELKKAIELGNLLKRPSAVTADLPPRLRQKLNHVGEYATVSNDGSGDDGHSEDIDIDHSVDHSVDHIIDSDEIVEGLEPDYDTHNQDTITPLVSEKKGFRKTLSSAGKKLSMSFKRDKKIMKH